MNDDLARSLFMDYLYDEIEDKDKKRLESYLEQHPALRKELDTLQHTRNLLQKMPLAEPDRQLMMVEPRRRSFKKWLNDLKIVLPQSGVGKFGLAAAVCLMLLMIVGSAAQLRLDLNDAGLSLSMGHVPAAREALTADRAQSLLTQVREENTALINEYVQTLRMENRRQLEQVVQHLQQQRINDLQAIDRIFDRFQQANDYRWTQTSQVLGEMLQAAEVRTDE